MAEKNNEKVIKIPEKSERLAEFVGIILGDGCISSYSKKKINIIIMLLELWEILDMIEII